MEGMKKIPFILYLIGGIFITAVSLYGYSLCRNRAGLPSEIKIFAEKKLLVRINGIDIETDQDIEFIFCRRRAGEEASFDVRTEKGIEKIQAKLDKYYSFPYPQVNVIIGFFLSVLAFTVFLLRPQEIRARVFYWASLFVSCSLTVNGGYYCLTTEWLSYIPGILFYAFYPLIPAFVLHFSLTFLRLKLKVYNYFIYFPAFVLVAVLEYLFLFSSITMSIDAYRQYQSSARVFRSYFVLYFLFSFIALILGYRKARLAEHKAQIKWILYGLVFGVGPFLFLYQLPRVLVGYPFISEELAPVFFVFIPAAFAVSIIRFKLMNIELIINKSLVYSILTAFTVSFYLLFVQIIQILFSRWFAVRQTVISVFGALAVALVFNPARKRIQKFVDKSFFRVSYDYKKSIFSFNERAHKIVRQPHLVDFFMMKVEKTIPIEYTGLKVISASEEKPKVLIARGRKGEPASFGFGATMPNRLFSKRKSVLTEIGVDFSMEEWIERNDLEMVIPMPFRTRALFGYVELGKKKSGTKFTGEDIELFLTLVEVLALNLERIHLQEEVIYERAEKEKFDELNRLKTEFISNVSHEIRTPMTSIQGMSEILRQGKIKGKEKQDEILELMTDECGRLSRFLHNILDYGKIEQQAMTYHFQKTDVIQIVVVLLRGFSVKKNVPGTPLWLSVDRDAVKQVLTNLIDNATKYSSDNREVEITVSKKSGCAEIKVKDRGMGIPAKLQLKIFEGFYRVPDTQKMAPRGVGLGLKIVKHIMEAHGGEVLVESQKGKGSTFILVFPR
jgi:signal transduction histidine kinase